MSPVVLAPWLLGSALLLAGGALAAGERHRIMARAGAAPQDQRSSADVRQVIRSIRHRGHVGSTRRRVSGVAVAASATVVGLVVAGPVGAVTGLVAGIAVPRWRRSRRVEARSTQIEEQLADAMDGIGAALRAGMSPSQAVAFAAEEGVPPLSDALRAVVQREALGVPLDESLDILVRQEPGDDVRLAVAVLQLQHRVGGDAPVILDDAVRTLRHRVAAAAELRSLTAQARLSGTILGLLPIGFFMFMAVISRHDVTAALSTPLGEGASIVGLALDGSAFLWIRHLLRGAS